LFLSETLVAIQAQNQARHDQLTSRVASLEERLNAKREPTLPKVKPKHIEQPKGKPRDGQQVLESPALPAVLAVSANREKRQSSIARGMDGMFNN
jgi:hypothetical protein